MAAFTTALTEVAANGNKRTYSTPAHTLSKASLVHTIQKLPSSEQTMAEFEVQTVVGTEDSNGDALPNNVLISTKVRRPKAGITADLDAALVIHLDLINSDEFDVSAEKIIPMQS